MRGNGETSTSQVQCLDYIKRRQTTLRPFCSTSRALLVPPIEPKNATLMLHNGSKNPKYSVEIDVRENNLLRPSRH